MRSAESCRHPLWEARRGFSGWSRRSPRSRLALLVALDWKCLGLDHRVEGARRIVRLIRSDATAKTKWLSEVAFFFSLASRPETAHEMLRQARAQNSWKGLRPLPTTCPIFTRLCLPKRIPLSSQASEGVQMRGGERESRCGGGV